MFSSGSATAILYMVGPAHWLSNRLLMARLLVDPEECSLQTAGRGSDCELIDSSEPRAQQTIWTQTRIQMSMMQRSHK